jgi:hypothetical protein
MSASCSYYYRVLLVLAARCSAWGLVGRTFMSQAEVSRDKLSCQYPPSDVQPYCTVTLLLCTGTICNTILLEILSLSKGVLVLPVFAAPRVAQGSAPDASAARMAIWVLMAAAGNRTHGHQGQPRYTLEELFLRRDGAIRPASQPVTMI